MDFLGRPSFRANRVLFLALEIENTTAEVKDLTFLGIRHRQYMGNNTGMKIKSIIGDKLFNDPNLNEFFDLCSLNPIMVRGFVFNTSMLYDMFKGKDFEVLQCNAWGSEQIRIIGLEKYRTDRTPQSVMFDTDVCLDISVNLKLTTIQPGERMVLFFDTNGRRSESALEAMIVHANSIYKKEKHRKILLII